jgi:hypothetical protein
MAASMHSREIDIARQIAGDIFKNAEVGLLVAHYVSQRYNVPVRQSGTAGC